MELGHTYKSMVVVATVNTRATDPPLVTRVRNASGNTFHVRVQRTDDLPDPINGVNVQYLVVEEGVYTEAIHGATMEAVKFTSTITDGTPAWNGETRSYLNAYTNPVVVGQVMTSHDEDFSAFWARGADRTSPPTSEALYVGKHVAQDPDTTRSDETIGFIVIEAGSGTVAGMEFVAGVSDDTIEGTGNGTAVSTAHSGLATARTAVVSQAGMDGTDGGWAVLYGDSPVGASTLDMAIEEDQLYDEERWHTTEQVAYLVFGE